MEMAFSDQTIYLNELSQITQILSNYLNEYLLNILSRATTVLEHLYSFCFLVLISSCCFFLFVQSKKLF